MRKLNAVLALILFFFAALQYNDPDGPYWFAVYAVAGLFPAVAAARPGWLSATSWAVALAVVVAVGCLAGFVTLAPAIGAGWIHVEEAREALGYLICAVTVAIALLGDRWHVRHVQAPGTASS